MRVRGTLVFDDVDELEELFAFDDFEAADELQALVDEGVEVAGHKVSFHVEGHLSNVGNVEFQDWLSDVAETATEGFVETWQEAFKGSYVRLLAGGDEEEVDGTFPLLDS